MHSANDYLSPAEFEALTETKVLQKTAWLFVRKTVDTSLNHPLIFKKYIILGLSLWVEKGQMIKQANKLQSSAKITAYFAVGSKEHDANRSMVDEVKLFYSYLPKNKNFKSKLEIIDDENHVSMVPASLTKAFKFLFGK